jgi:hypothetical protein
LHIDRSRIRLTAPFQPLGLTSASGHGKIRVGGQVGPGLRT